MNLRMKRILTIQRRGQWWKANFRNNKVDPDVKVRRILHRIKYNFDHRRIFLLKSPTKSMYNRPDRRPE